MQFLGHVTRRVDLKRDFAQVDSDKVKSRTEEAERGRHARTYEITHLAILTNSVMSLETGRGKDGFGRTLSLPPMRSAPSSPFLASIGSPRIRPSPAPSPRGSPLIHTSNYNGTSAVPALRTRLVQLLAFGTASEAELIRRTRGASIEAAGILAEIAVRKKNAAGEWELKDTTWKEVKVWDSKYFSPRQREQIVKMAIAAFDRLGIPDDAKERRALLHKEEAEALEASHHTPSNGSPFLASEGAKVMDKAVSDLRVSQNVLKKRRNTGNTIDDDKPEPVKRQKTVSANEGAREIGLGISTVKPTSKFSRKSSEESLPKKPSLLGSSPVNSEYSPSVAPSPRPNEASIQAHGAVNGQPKAKSAVADTPAPADLMMLAKKFKAQHVIYAHLYKQLKASKTNGNEANHQEQYLELMRMHDELGRWKTKLYAAV